MNRIASILTVLTLAVLFSAGSAHAQSNGHRMDVNIPFEFTVGSVSLPAGQYEFQRTGTGGDVVLVHDANGHSQFTIVTSLEANEYPEKSALKFATTADGRHVLTQLWDEPAGVHCEFQYEPANAELAERSFINRTVTARR